MVSLGVAEPVGVSNTAEWWPKEHRGFAIGAHHQVIRLERYLVVLQWPPSLLILVRRIGAMPFSWNYICCTGINFWAIYSTRKRYSEFHQSCVDNQFTPPTDFVHDEGEEKQVRIVHGNV